MRFFVVSFFLLASAAANAGIIGEDVDLTSNAFNGSATVSDPGAEFTWTGNTGVFDWTVDFQGPDGLQIRIDGNVNTAHTAGFYREFTFSGIHDLISATLISSEFSGFGTPAIISTTSDGFTFSSGNFGVSEAVGQDITSVIQIAVPGPATGALFALSLAGLFMTRRR